MNSEVETNEMTSPAPGESTVSIKKVKKAAAPTTTKKEKVAPKAKSKKVTKAAPKAKKAKAVVTKVTIKGAKKAKVAGEAKRGRTSQYAGMKLYKLVPKNPRREGTAGYNSFSLITNGMKYEKFIELGGRSGDLAFDIAHKYVEVKNS